MDAPIDWLLEGDAWIAYRARLDLLEQAEEDAAVKTARAGMLADARVQSLIAELSDWPETVIASHKSAGQPFHKLTFLADLGLRVEDPGVEEITARILEHPSAEGPFQLPATISTAHGGAGREVWAWALCDAPLILYALVKLGLEEDPRVKAGVNFLAGLARENGWPCVVSPELGNFRGPGRKEDPCPFATLAMLKLCAQVEALRDGAAARSGAEALLSLWSDSRTRHPYIFYMGTDFRKLKAPFVWYDLLHVLDVLSRFAWLRGDARLQDMLGVMNGKADDQGRYTVESAWTAWKEWEFGQKKEPSRWLTLLAWRVERRMNRDQEDEGDKKTA